MFHPDVCTGINLIETGKRIDAVMRANGVTTRKLARAINVTEQSDSKWRNGRCLPDIENLFIFCRMFEVKMDDIVV